MFNTVITRKEVEEQNKLSNYYTMQCSHVVEYQFDTLRLGAQHHRWIHACGVHFHLSTISCDSLPQQKTID